jgi:hypothetical protein
MLRLRALSTAPRHGTGRRARAPVLRVKLRQQVPARARARSLRGAQQAAQRVERCSDRAAAAAARHVHARTHTRARALQRAEWSGVEWSDVCQARLEVGTPGVPRPSGVDAAHPLRTPCAPPAHPPRTPHTRLTPPGVDERVAGADDAPRDGHGPHPPPRTKAHRHEGAGEDGQAKACTFNSTQAATGHRQWQSAQGMPVQVRVCVCVGGGGTRVRARQQQCAGQPAPAGFIHRHAPA